MTGISLLFFGRNLLLIAINLFVSCSVIKRPLTLKELAVYSFLGTIAHELLNSMCFFVPQVLLGILFHITLQTWVLEAPLFPDAAFCITIPFILMLSSQYFLIPLFSRFFRISLGASARRGMLLLPVTALTIYYICRTSRKPKPAPKSKPQRELHPRRELTIMVSAAGLYSWSVFSLINEKKETSLLNLAYVCSAAILVPMIGFCTLNEKRKAAFQDRIIEYYAGQKRSQDCALEVLRQERHDYLNELTLISTYLQMEEWDKALQSVTYAAASIHCPYEHPAPPGDAWLAVLKNKKQTAEELKIDFQVTIKAEPPRDYAEQGLLPKLIANLVDNAFAAVLKTSDPKVRLSWSKAGENRILAVCNNGPPIPPQVGKMIFRPGITSKPNAEGNSGWGLVICRKAAEKLGGTLTYRSDQERTSFFLCLPPAAIRRPHSPLYTRRTSSPRSLRIIPPGIKPRTETRG